MARGSGCRDCGKSFPGAHVYELCADCVRKRLVGWVAEEIVKKLLPAAKCVRRGREYRVGSIDGEPGQSMVIWLASGLWYDYAAGRGGDMLDLIACCLSYSRVEALHRAREWLGQPERRVRSRPMPVPEREDADIGTRRIWAEEIWREGGAVHRGDLVSRYCFERAVDLERLARANAGNCRRPCAFIRGYGMSKPVATIRRCSPGSSAAMISFSQYIGPG